ncbi:DUF3828 domain-containing protein [bacterium]|nr:DUF3828 domain-containing protein [bacterium]
MKTWHSILLTAALLAGTTLSALAAPQTPTQVVQSFYSTVTDTSQPQLSADQHPQFTKELKELFAKVSEYPFPYCMDFDPWGGAQVGIDKFAILSGEKHGQTAEIEVSVHRCGCDNALVKVLMRQEDGEWKIANFIVPQDEIDLLQILREKIDDYASLEKK